VRGGKISRDSLIVSCFIVFHVGSRAIGAGAKMAVEGPDRFQPFATLLSHAFKPENAEGWRIFGYWGALGSVLAFLMYFPYSKHIHLFAAPVKYLTAREARSGELPAIDGDLEAAVADGGESLGAKRLEDLAWPRMLDAYACIQCNRCQDVCPAAVTGKALSPAALEINKRMELNALAGTRFGAGEASPRPLLAMALTPEAAWACTTCGACMQACPVENEQMLDIIDVRRRQVMVEGEFPVQLQSAFRGMERAGNPWGINHEQRMAWAEGLRVPTVEERPDADVLYWVGCAPSYDPQSQKTARALVQLMERAGVRFAVLGKKERCTGDSARRAGNEYLYQQLAKQNIETLNAVRPKTIVTTCPHCMNTIANEYRQLGGEYTVVHHTELLERLVAEGRLDAAQSAASVTYHDPCYLGRHNGVYDAPRNVLRVLSNDFVELPRRCENSFCCGAGGAQFWKEEEPGPEKVPANRFREVEQTLEGRQAEKVLAVGCPFCKTMLSATPEKAETSIEIRDVAELLLEGVLKKAGVPLHEAAPVAVVADKSEPMVEAHVVTVAGVALPMGEVLTKTAETQAAPERKKWTPVAKAAATESAATQAAETAAAESIPPRKKWTPKQSG
jgi:Fe-S oxidoreductase